MTNEIEQLKAQLAQYQDWIQQLQGIYTKEELEVIRNTFGSEQGVGILTTIRNFFWQAPLSDRERETLKSFSAPQWIDMLKRMYFPEMDFTKPLGQVRDFWSYMPTQERDEDKAYVEIDARQIVINYMTQRFRVLETGQEGKDDIQLKDLVPTKGNRQGLVNIAARNMIMSNMDGSAKQMLQLANMEEKTKEQIAEENRINSTE